jgi:hypothetical protein
MVTRRLVTHYILGAWPDPVAACGLRGLAHRPVIVTRDPSHVSCRSCRVAMVRMATRWETLGQLAQ